MPKYVTVKLTEDQVRALIDNTTKVMSVNEFEARKVNMGLDPERIAFQKRLITTLAKAKS